MTKEIEPKLTHSERARLGGLARANKLSPERLTEIGQKGAHALHEAGLANRFTSESAKAASLTARAGDKIHRFTHEENKAGGKAAQRKIIKQIGKQGYRQRMQALSRQSRLTLPKEH